MANGMVARYAVGELCGQDGGGVADSAAHAHLAIHPPVQRKGRSDPKESQQRREPYLLCGRAQIQYRILAQQRAARQLERPLLVEERQRGQGEPTAMIGECALIPVYWLRVEADCS